MCPRWAGDPAACRQSHQSCLRHQGLEKHRRHRLRLDLKPSRSGGASPSRQLLPGLCSRGFSRREKANPSCAITGASSSRGPAQ